MLKLLCVLHIVSFWYQALDINLIHQLNCNVANDPSFEISHNYLSLLVKTLKVGGDFDVSLVNVIDGPLFYSFVFPHCYKSFVDACSISG